MGKAMPEGWLDYTPLGQPIAGTRFISFKVPLKMDQNAIAEDNRLSPSSLMKMVPNLGLIIDLTDTDRYYDPSVFRNNGVQHSKIRIQGRILPSMSIHKEFWNIVNGFLSQNSDNDKLIGVHCTHGCNRTGLMICMYLVHNDDAFDAEKALTAFQTARGHEIHRENYVDAIRKAVKGKMHQETPAVPTNSTGNAAGGYLSWRLQRQTHQQPAVPLAPNHPEPYWYGPPPNFGPPRGGGFGGGYPPAQHYHNSEWTNNARRGGPQRRQYQNVRPPGGQMPHGQNISGPTGRGNRHTRWNTQSNQGASSSSVAGR